MRPYGCASYDPSRTATRLCVSLGRIQWEAAFDISITLQVAGIDTAVTVVKRDEESAVRTYLMLIRMAGVVLLAWFVAEISVHTRTGPAVEIGVKGRANANASIASSGSFVGVVWAARTKDGVTDVYLATSRDGGRAFGTPVRVNEVPGDASVSGEQPPRVVLSARGSSNPAVVVLWTAKSVSGTRLVSARSTDGGKSFAKAELVPGSDASGNRGWESAAVTPNGDVVAVWLDHREVPARPAGATAGPHQHGAASQQSAADGVARAQLSQIFFAKLNESASGRAIAPGVCYCCKTSVAVGANGTIVTAWRHVYAGNIRDVALAKSSDGGRTFASPVRVSEDNWVLDGCPENGPAVAIDQANTIHVVWPTLVRGSAGSEETLALFYAASKDGQRFTRRQQISTEGVPRHPQIAVGPGDAITVAWDEQLKGTRRIAVAGATSNDKNDVRFVRQLVSDEPGTYPAVASLTDAAVVAWTSSSSGESVLRVERLAMRQSRGLR